MSFEEWWESFWEPTEGFRSVNLKDIARTAWEAAQAQDKGVAGEIKEMWAEYPSLRDEFAMAVADSVFNRVNYEQRTEHELSLNLVCSVAAEECYAFADAMLKEREK